MCTHTCNYQQSHSYIYTFTMRVQSLIILHNILLRILLSFVWPFIDVHMYGRYVHVIIIIMYVLQFELMIESVLIAREKWLKPVSHSYNDTAIICIIHNSIKQHTGHFQVCSHV